MEKTKKIEKEEKKVINKRAYTYLGVIFEDDPQFDNQYFNITTTRESIWIRHDKDINEETGEYKKPHYHFIIKFQNAKTITSVASMLDVKSNMLEYVKNLNSSLKYLIHFGNDNKYQYELNDVESNSLTLEKRFKELVLKATPESEKVMSIFDFIDSATEVLNMKQVFKFAMLNGFWDVYRRSYSIIKDLVAIKNANIMNRNYYDR